MEHARKRIGLTGIITMSIAVALGTFASHAPWAAVAVVAIVALAAATCIITKLVLDHLRKDKLIDGAIREGRLLAYDDQIAKLGETVFEPAPAPVESDISAANEKLGKGESNLRAPRSPVGGSGPHLSEPVRRRGAGKSGTSPETECAIKP